MKLVFLISTIALFLACDPSKPASKNINLSVGQTFLHNLRDSLKIEYRKGLSEQDKRIIIQKYHDKLEAYLLEKPIDSIRVTVDEIVKNGMTVTTRFHDNDIEFKYGINFGNDSMPPRLLKAYIFMIGLKPGTDTITSFSFTGACTVNRPNDNTIPTFQIFAIPIPLELGDK